QQPGQRRVAAVARPQGREALDLRPHLGRDVQQEPGGAVGADRHGLLRAGHDAAPRAPRLTAVLAAAVPLRHAAAGRGSEDADLHERGTRRLAPGAVGRRSAIGLGRLDGGIHRIPIGEVTAVAADFGAHVDFDERRSLPAHGGYSAPPRKRVKLHQQRLSHPTAITWQMLPFCWLSVARIDTPRPLGYPCAPCCGRSFRLRSWFPWPAPPVRPCPRGPGWCTSAPRTAARSWPSTPPRGRWPRAFRSANAPGGSSCRRTASCCTSPC